MGTGAAQAPRELKPGWNLFSKDQDIQLGKEAAAQVEKEATVVRDAELVNYVRRIGASLAATAEAGGYPYSFQAVADKSITSQGDAATAGAAEEQRRRLAPALARLAVVSAAPNSNA